MACSKLAEVLLHEGSDALDAAGLVNAARDADLIVADRLTAGPAEIFAKLPKLRAFVRCAVDIRNVDVEAASAAGVLVTRAGPGFVQSVSELALGFMVDLSRGVSRATADYHAGRAPQIVMGRQLSGSQHRHHRLRQHWPLSGAPGAGARHDGATSPTRSPPSRIRTFATCRSTNCCAIPTTSSVSSSPTRTPRT